MKDILGLLDKRTAFTASIVCFCFVILVGIVGFLGRTSYSPYLINTYFGITESVTQQVNGLIDAFSTKQNPSGYSRTFTFEDGAANTVNQTLIFYAQDDQHIKIDITPNTAFTDRSAPANASRGYYDVRIDDEPYPGSRKDLDVPEEIRLTSDKLPDVTSVVGTGSHTLTIHWGAHRYKEISSFDCLVLVSNVTL